jgi:3-isopropylmalate dehydrogenase
MKRILRTKKIAIIGGDGIGPVVIAEARALLELYRDALQLPLDLWDVDLGAHRYLADGTTLPDNLFRAMRDDCAAVLLGALGDHRVPGMEHAREILLGLRLGCDLYANIRPIRALSDALVPLKGKVARDVDFVVFRENTEGVYAGLGGQLRRGTAHEVAINEDVNTRRGVERIIRAAFGYAREHSRTRVHMADKSNAMRHGHELWVRVFREVAREYPEIEPVHMFIDALCLRILQTPEEFQVIVTNNLFGDILGDIASVLQGGLGMAPNANVHPSHTPRVALFEQAHGSAPLLAGRDVANPFGAMRAVGLMLAHLGWPMEMMRIERSVARALEKGEATADVGGKLGTRAAGQALRSQIQRSFERSS